jgi:hypothetical protein
MNKLKGDEISRKKKICPKMMKISKSVFLDIFQFNIYFPKWIIKPNA